MAQAIISLNDYDGAGIAARLTREIRQPHRLTASRKALACAPCYHLWEAKPMTIRNGT